MMRRIRTDYCLVGGFSLLMVAVLGAVIWIKVSVWDECRVGGHSVFYCWHLVSS
jgi:hypothetical protein